MENRAESQCGNITGYQSNRARRGDGRAKRVPVREQPKYMMLTLPNKE